MYTLERVNVKNLKITEKETDFSEWLKEHDRKKKYWDEQHELRKKADFWGDVFGGYVLLAGVYLIVDGVETLKNLGIFITEVVEFLSLVLGSSTLTFDFQFMMDMIEINFISREINPIGTITVLGIALGLWIKSEVMHKNVDWSVFKEGYYSDEDR